MVDKGAGERQQADLELGRKLHCFDTGRLTGYALT